MGKIQTMEITGCDMVELLRKAYALSVPMGMGYLHYTPEPLTREEAADILQKSGDGSGGYRFDYVRGRAVKLNVIHEDGKHFIPVSWYDHSENQLLELLEHVC